jgi:hypothetical protein
MTSTRFVRFTSTSVASACTRVASPEASSVPGGCEVTWYRWNRSTAL